MHPRQAWKVVEETLEKEDARETFGRILGKPPHVFTGDTGNPLSIVIEEVALRVAGKGDGASA